MSRFIHRRAVLQGGLALCASLIIPPVRACEYLTGTLRITHPWTRATGPDTFAVLCMKFDEVTETDRLIGVETPVAARAELVGEGAGPGVSLLIPAGREITLSEDRTHIRLMDLRHPLLIGRSYPLQLAFEKGGTANYRLSVDYLRPLLPFPGGHRS